jgi:hypothetical protein
VTAPFPPPTAVDLLTQATTFVRPHLSRSIPIGDRLRNLWAAVAAARDLGAIGVIEDEFMGLAREAGLAADLGPHADEDLRPRHSMGDAGSESLPMKSDLTSPNEFERSFRLRNARS